jgi:hypothetical protein
MIYRLPSCQWAKKYYFENDMKSWILRNFGGEISSVQGLEGIQQFTPKYS